MLAALEFQAADSAGVACRVNIQFLDWPGQLVVSVKSGWAGSEEAGGAAALLILFIRYFFLFWLYLLCCGGCLNTTFVPENLCFSVTFILNNILVSGIMGRKLF